MSSEATVNIAVIGAGAIGLHHIEGYKQHPAARVVALAETSPERGREAADKYGIPEVVTDYRDLLQREDIQVFSIALPNYLHAPVSIEALEAGKHVMLDKPMATNAADAARIVALAEEKKLHFMVGQNMRFNGAAQAVRKLVREGALGEVYHAKAVWQRRAGIPRLGSWFTQTKFAGGGATYDIGVHVLDLALHLMDDFDAVSVSGQTFAKFGPRGLGEGGWGKSEVNPDRPFDVDDFCVALIKLRSGRTIQLEVSWAAAMEVGDINGVQLFGTDGGAATNPPRAYRAGVAGYEITQLTPLAPFVNENRAVHFVDVVLGKEQVYVSPRESLAVQRILDGIYESAKTGREVRLD
ncbi:Gfo/Idh/MocA family protein [Congregicoccus parvus]|uniref:Gfo/Idh/MocA family protein n=1 Tax=Congregicoccus parvus TaxID=3081749 RepID=UPI003FA5E435